MAPLKIIPLWHHTLQARDFKGREKEINYWRNVVYSGKFTKRSFKPILTGNSGYRIRQMETLEGLYGSKAYFKVGLIKRLFAEKPVMPYQRKVIGVHDLEVI